LLGRDKGRHRGSLLAPTLIRLPGPIASPSRFPRPRHAGRQVIPRTVLALLLLNIIVIHAHVELDGGHIFMAEQLLQAERVVAGLQVADGEGVPQDVRADALVGDVGPLLESCEQQGHAVLRQRQARLGEEEVILACAAPLGQFFFAGAMPVEVIEQVAQAVLPEGNAALLGPLALDGDHPVLAVEIGEAQTAQLGDPDTRIEQHPEDGAIAHRGTGGDGTGFVGRRTGEEQPLKLFRADGADERLSHFGEDYPVEGVALYHLAAHQPVAKGAHRTRVGLDGAFTTNAAPSGGRFAHRREPGADIGGVDLGDQGDSPLFFQELLEEAERGAMPLQRFGAVVAAFLIIEEVGDGPLQGRGGAAPGEQVFLPFPFAAAGWLAFGRFSGCLLATRLGLGVQFVALGGGPGFGDFGRRLR